MSKKLIFATIVLPMAVQVGHDITSKAVDRLVSCQFVSVPLFCQPVNDNGAPPLFPVPLLGLTASSTATSTSSALTITSLST